MQTYATPIYKKSKNTSTASGTRQTSFFSPVRVQPKLTIGAADDPYEREADAMADRVMMMPANNVHQETFFKPTPNTIQRQPPAASDKTSEPTREGSPGDVFKAVTAIPQVNLFLENLGQQFLLTLSRTWDNPTHLGKIGIITTGGSLLAGLGLTVFAARNNPEALDLMSSPLSGTVFRLPASLVDAPLPLRALGLEANFDRPSPLSPLRNNMVGLHVDVGLLLQKWAPGLGFGGADSMTGMGAPPSTAIPIGRKCANCEDEEKLQRKESNTSADTDTSLVENTLQSSGAPLDKHTQSFMEQRFGYDFSNVKIHTDTVAAKSAGSINALAYTSGNNIVFNQNQFSPQTETGKKLLAHELTHVVQQSNNRTANSVRRYSDTDHHIVEGVALSSVFSEKEIKSIERGNMERDYSQLGKQANSVLLGENSDFGGYKTHEHFDHFIFDREKNRWVSHDEYEKIWDDNTTQWVKRRISVSGKTGNPKITPIQYISGELQKAVEKDMPDSTSFVHIGNAFHTIEDFFAHSNFVELTKGDFSAGKELTTHPPGAEGPSSEDSILSNVLDPVPAAFYKDRFNAGYAKASPVSHGRMAKDFHQHPNHDISITLAAIVVRQVAILIKEAFRLKTKEQRIEFVQNSIMDMLTGYFRPPDEKDKWWEKLLADDNGLTSKRIKELQARTPVTVNQSPFSPLRTLEATRFSSWKAIGLGTSFSVPLKNKTFFTAGYMLYVPGSGQTPDSRMLVAPRSDWDQSDTPRIIFGAQISGSFDWPKR